MSTLRRCGAPDYRPELSACDIRTIYAILTDQLEHFDSASTETPSQRSLAASADERRLVEDTCIATIYAKLIDRFEELDEVQRSTPTKEQLTSASEEKARVEAVIKRMFS